MEKHIFFDLDGTLTNPSDGITNCIRYAMEKLGKDCPPKEELLKYIGPPLQQSFMELLGTKDPAEGENAVKIYRERFSTIGLFENYPYDRVPEMLRNLKESGYNMFVCTSKPQVFAERILDHFGLSQYLEKVYGSSLSCANTEKDVLISGLLASEKLEASDCAMIGDRIYDIRGAYKNGVTPYGVSYGFGERAEFDQAAKIFDSPYDIESHFKRS